MRDVKNEKKPVVTWKRAVAGVLVVAMLGVSGMSAMVDVSIQSEGEEDLAKNYLIEQTPYVQDNTINRMIEKFRSLKKASDYEDYYNQACVQIAEEKYDRALESLEKCLEFLKGDARSLEGDLVVENRTNLLADVLIKKGCILQLQEKTKEAKETLEESLPVISDRTQKIEVYALLSQIYLKDQDFEKAESYYEKLLGLSESDEDISTYIYMYGIVLVQKEDYKNAEKMLTRAMKADDSSEGCYYYRGVSRMMTEQYEGAIEDFTESIGRDSFVQQSYYSRAVTKLSIDTKELDGPAEDLQNVIDYKGKDRDEEIVSQAAQLLEVLEEAGRKDAEYESESESEL